MSNGRFDGQVKIEWLTGVQGNRPMRLLEDFAFIDPDGIRWLATAGRIVSGSSLPPALWNLVGEPAEADCQRASVLHDVACQDRLKPSRDVHRMLYDALICDGVDHATALRFYAAARLFGDRWNGGDSGRQSDEGHLERSGPEPSIEVVEEGIDVVLGE